MATAAGAILGSHPLWAPVVLVTWVVVVAGTRWIALASLAAAGSVVVVALVAREDLLWALALAAVVFVRHGSNVRSRWAERRAR